MMLKANVNHVKSKMDKIVRGGEIPCVCRSRSLYSGRVVGGAIPMSMERKKSDKEAKKEQRNGLTGKSASL
jgi:hypothetical protein